MNPFRIGLRINTLHTAELVSKLEERFKEAFPGNLFHWRFFSDLVDRRYDQQKIVRNQLVFFTLLAVGVACLGLLGMMSNKIIEKTKEIGIRKVLGANMSQIGSILLNTTARQLAVSILIGIPLSWKLSTQYLERFTEQITISWWHYALPVTLLMLIMLATVATVLLKASATNPVEALKHE
jgi:putative ABC transport system permease protein